MGKGVVKLGDGNWAVKDGNLLAVKETNRRFKNTEFTVERGTRATYVGRDGLIKESDLQNTNLVLNHDFSQIGSEEVTNGDFSQEGSELIPDGNFTNQAAVDFWSIADTGGVERATKSLEDGFMRLTYNIANSSALLKGSLLTSGKSYKVTFRAKGTATNKFGSIGDNGNITANPQLAVSNPNLTTDWQDYEFYVPVTSSLLRMYLTGAISIGQTLDITNISVKEVGQDWEFTDGATITSNGVRIVSDGTYQRVKQDNVLTVGKQYKIQYEIKEKNGGNLKLASSLGLLTIPTTVGVHTVYGEALLTFLGFERSGACDITLTNISVKEVGQNWTFSSGWGVGDGKAVGDGTSFSFLTQINNLTNKNLKLTFEIKDYQSGTFRVPPTERADGLDERYSGNGQKTVYYQSTVDNFRFQQQQFVGSVTNISIQEIKTATPRIDFTNNTDGHLLLEPARTNIITYSENFTQSFYIKDSGVSVDTTNNVSPSGESNATKIDVTDNGRIYANTTSGTYAPSVFIKAGTFSHFKFLGSNVDLVAGTYSGGTIESFGNGWFRITKAYTGNRPFQVQAYPDGTYSSHTTSGNYFIWGAQVEAGAYPTSYIPTVGSTATRSADVCKDSGTVADFNSAEGVLFADIAALNNTTENQISISLSNSGGSDRLLLYFSESSSVMQAQFRKNSSAYVSISAGVVKTNQNKVAISWKSGKNVLFANGVKATAYGTGSETTATTFDEGDIISLQFSPGKNFSSNYFFGKTKQLEVYKTGFSDDQLIRLTGTLGTHFFESYASMAGALTYTIQ